MLCFLLLAVSAVLAEPLAPRPVLPSVSQLRGELTLLGGVDSWPEQSPLAGELRLGGGYANALQRGSFGLRYSGVLQAWQADAYLLDAHLLEAAAESRALPRFGDLSLGGLASLRGSGMWGWTEAVLAGSARLAEGGTWARFSLGPSLRLGDDERAVGAAAGLAASARFTPSWSGFAIVEGRSWPAEDFPVGYLEGDLGGGWEGSSLGVAAGVGVSGAAGGKDDKWIAGLPPSGLLTARLWVAPSWSPSSHLTVRLELSAERAGEDYLRGRALLGIGGRLGRLRRGGVQPEIEPSATFTLDAPGARGVAVAGSFTGWEPLPMEGDGHGGWSLSLELPPGEHLYVYLVDGQAVVPPEALRRRPDGFGSENGVVVVKEPREE